MSDNRWHALVPAKRLREAKSRLGRDDLTLPFLADVIHAIAGSTLVTQVTVISSDPAIISHVTTLGATTIPDNDSGGLKEAINSGLQWCDNQQLSHVLVVLGDLPCLTSAQIDQFLTAGCHHEASFLADAEGTGSTMWMRTTQSAPSPKFGIRSRAAHRESGVYEVNGDCFVGARRDVDTAVNLWDALRIGVGTATRNAVNDPAREELDRESREILVTVSKVDPLLAIDEHGHTYELDRLHHGLNDRNDPALLRPKLGQRLIIRPSIKK